MGLYPGITVNVIRAGTELSPAAAVNEREHRVAGDDGIPPWRRDVRIRARKKIRRLPQTLREENAPSGINRNPHGADPSFDSHSNAGAGPPRRFRGEGARHCRRYRRSARGAGLGCGATAAQRAAPGRGLGLLCHTTTDHGCTATPSATISPSPSGQQLSSFSDPTAVSTRRRHTSPPPAAGTWKSTRSGLYSDRKSVV